MDSETPYERHPEPIDPFIEWFQEFLAAHERDTRFRQDQEFVADYVRRLALMRKAWLTKKARKG